MKYNIGDIVTAEIIPGNKKIIGIILKTRMWNTEVDYKILICGKPNEDYWILESLIIEKIG
jgi:hypothetical protein